MKKMTNTEEKLTFYVGDNINDCKAMANAEISCTIDYQSDLNLKRANVIIIDKQFSKLEKLIWTSYRFNSQKRLLSILCSLLLLANFIFGSGISEQFLKGIELTPKTATLIAVLEVLIVWGWTKFS